MCKQTTKELKQLIRDMIELAEVGEYHTGGRTEAEAYKDAETLAKARQVVGQEERP